MYTSPLLNTRKNTIFKTHQIQIPFTGLAAFAHIISYYRQKLKFWKVLLFALFILTLYPIIPTLTLCYTLYQSPSYGEWTEKYDSASRFLTTVRVVHGCFEAPLQLIYNVYLINKGILDFEFTDKRTATFGDEYGNEIILPYTATFSIGKPKGGFPIEIESQISLLILHIT